MSGDPATAYGQGVTEADAALNTAYNLGLTLADKTGTVIYYNMEWYDASNTPCNDAAKSFISGWTAQLRARGNQAGLYGTASIIGSFVGIANVPDVVWAAAWGYSNYQNNLTTSHIPYLGDTLWVNHQRIWQYAGGHDETWGSTTLNIDSSVVDSLVAYAYAPTVSTQIYLTYPNSPFRDFQVLVNGSDARSPIASYSLQKQVDGGDWLDVGTIITSSARVSFSIISPDDSQHTFSFRAQAKDQAGYMSQYPAVGDSSHTVPAACAVSGDSAEPDNSPGQAKPLVIGAPPQNHNFQAQGDVDWVTLAFQAGNSYMIATDHVGGYADTVITLYRPDGVTVLAENDDVRGNWPSSLLGWKATTSGTYYLKVRHFDTYGYGCSTAYTLSAVPARDTFLPVVRR
jgi:hypothetical protein